jgi:esterase/lipase superfamily enzyme
MNREYQKWFSPVLGKEMEMLIFGDRGTPVLFFPTRTARFFDYENWNIVAAVQAKIEAGLLQLYCVDSLDIESFYAQSPPLDKIKRHIEYERYILTEVIPFIRTKNRNTLTVAGCSFGGYHAVNIAFRHPHLFGKVVGMSARYDLTVSSPTFADLLDGFFNEDIYYNMPGMYVPNLEDETILAQIKKLKIILVIGEEDPFFDSNQKMDAALTEKEIPHEFYVWEGEAHRPRHWRMMVQLYL